MTHSCWHDSFMLTWLIHVDMTHSCWHDSFMLTWLIHVDRTHSCWHDSFMLTWLIHVDMTHSCWHDLFMLTWLIHMWDMTGMTWRDLFTCVTWPIRTWDVTHSYTGRDSFTEFTWFFKMGGVTYPLHRYEFGQPKFFSKTFIFSIIFYSTCHISGGGQFQKVCRSRKKESKQSGITWKQSEPVRSLLRSRKEENVCGHCDMNKARISKGSTLWGVAGCGRKSSIFERISIGIP